MDYGFSERGCQAYNWGPDGIVHELKDGWPIFSDFANNNPDGLSSGDVLSIYTTQGGRGGNLVIDHWTRLLPKGNYTTPETIKALNTWETENGLYSASLPTTSLLPEETSSYANMFNEIDTYVAEMYTKFIMGETPLTDFDSYISNLKKMGMDDVIRMRQGALDRYNKR
jgi:putative aldouronate transport system substrate-binding protein